MNRNELIATILIILATVGTITGIFAIEKFRRTQFYTVELLAREPDHGNWYPRRFTVPYSKEVKILLRNTETVTHGFALPAFGVDAKEIKAGEAKVIRFTADKRGTFPFMCTIWCSERHLEMTGEITVE